MILVIIMQQKCTCHFYFLSVTPALKKRNVVFESVHAKTTRIFQHISLSYANDLAGLNEGTINHFNYGLF